MKRLTLTLCLLLVTGAAHAFDPAPSHAPVRIAILRAPDAYYYENADHVHRAIRESLRSELRARGFEVSLIDWTYDELPRDARPAADYYIEIAGDSRTEDHGGVGVTGRHAAMSMGMVVADVAADVFVYDADTLEQLAHESLSKRDHAFVPTSVGVGGANVFAWIAMPFIERAQVRGVSRQLARDIAGRVENVVRAR
ncbi:MAG TPA: hypothetical protein VND45_15230 [Thermoanaerobaculia bacterium]|jgi:hypothetical protein|nr:hypothetical protein [Thermoanaerobaculia bacterium]